MRTTHRHKKTSYFILYKDHINAKMEVDLALLKSTKGLLKISEMVRLLYKYDSIVFFDNFGEGQMLNQWQSLSYLNSNGVGLIF